MPKKIFVFILLIMCLFIVACKDNNNNGTDDNGNNTDVDDKEAEISSIKQGEVDNFNNYLVLFGRTYFSQGRLALDHCGTGFEASFTGTSLSLEVVAASTKTLMVVYIDGVEYKTIMLTRNGTLNVCKDLENKEHIVRFIKASSTASGPVLISEINTDGVINKYQKDYKINIEFVGDSITCGAGTLADNTTPSTSFDNNDVTKAYSYVCANLLGAYFSISATEGICVKATTAVKTQSIDLYQSYSLNNHAKYDFSKNFDIVVINLGTNDADYLAGHPEYGNQFATDYLELVNLIREKNPKAEIICIYGHMGVNSKIRDGIRKVVSDLSSNGDDHIYWCPVTSDFSGAGSHPGRDGAYKQGVELYKFIIDNNLVDASLIETNNNEKPYIDGKKLVVFGDSITALGTWGKDAAEDLNMYFFNAAMGGITSAQGIDRFNATVKESGADFVTICFGQNDLIMNTYNTPKVSLADFKTNMTRLVEMVRSIGATPILLTTNPLNPDIFWTAQGQNKDNYTEVGGDPLAWLDEYNKVTRTVARETNCDLVDMRVQFSEKYYRNALSDGIHLNARGNEIFKDALVSYFRNRYANDPSAQKVNEEDLNIYVDSTDHVSIISKKGTDWYTVDTSLMKIESGLDTVYFYNTNGLWPEAHYTLTNPVVIDYSSGVLYYDIEVANVNTSILIFFNGSTPSAYQNGEYVVINSYISKSVNSVGDIEGPCHLVGSIKLSVFNIAKAYLRDGKLIINGIKVFAAGTSGARVTIKELSVGLGE